LNTFESPLISFQEDLVKFGSKPPTKTFFITKKILQNSYRKLFLNASLQAINLWHGYMLLARKSSTTMDTQTAHMKMLFMWPLPSNTNEHQR